MEKEVKIYVLKNPETNQIHYVGRSVNPKGRYRVHIHLALKSKHKNIKDAWICSLLNKNTKPTLEIIESVNQSEAIEREKFWIEELRKTCDLKNSRDYIENTYLFSEESRKKMSESHKGKPSSRKGTTTSNETKEKIRKSKTGIKCLESTKIKLGKPVLQYDKNGKFIKEWNSTKEVERTLGLKQTLISSTALGRKYRKTCGGFIWKYKINN